MTIEVLDTGVRRGTIFFFCTKTASQLPVNTMPLAGEAMPPALDPIDRDRRAGREADQQAVDPHLRAVERDG